MATSSIFTFLLWFLFGTMTVLGTGHGEFEYLQYAWYECKRMQGKSGRTRIEGFGEGTRCVPTNGVLHGFAGTPCQEGLCCLPTPHEESCVTRWACSPFQVQTESGEDGTAE